MKVGLVATAAWGVYGVIAALMAALALWSWGGAIALRGPVLYGEGAVAHAASLAPRFGMYAEPAGVTFTAANYPPLYLVAAGLGDPFVTGRLLSVAATLAVAGLIAWRARAAPRAVQAVLGVGWLALAPVAIWGAAVKPDLVAVALSVSAVLALERRHVRRAAVLLVLASLAKPTAILVTVALLLWVAARDRELLRRFLVAGGIAAAVAALALVPFGYGGLWLHVVRWNQLPWTLESAALLLFVAVVVYAALVGTGLLARAFSGSIGAYAAAGLGIVLLGGREGATINYLLDLGAAASLALAGVAPVLARSARYPAIAIVNLVLAALLLDPLGIVPGRAATTGAWGDPARLAAVKTELSADEHVLAEDSGLLVATGHQVSLDDLFLWSRLVASGAIDPGPVLLEVRAARYTAIVSEVDLAHLGAAAGYERARWEPSLVQAIVERYRLAARLPGGLFVYRPR